MGNSPPGFAGNWPSTGGGGDYSQTRSPGRSATSPPTPTPPPPGPGESCTPGTAPACSPAASTPPAPATSTTWSRSPKAAAPCQGTWRHYAAATTYSSTPGGGRSAPTGTAVLSGAIRGWDCGYATSRSRGAPETGTPRYPSIPPPPAPRPPGLVL